MAKHAKAETLFGKFDRLIAELQDAGPAYGLHRSDRTYINFSADFQREKLNMWPIMNYNHRPMRAAYMYGLGLRARGRPFRPSMFEPIALLPMDRGPHPDLAAEIMSRHSFARPYSRPNRLNIQDDK